MFGESLEPHEAIYFVPSTATIRVRQPGLVFRLVEILGSDRSASCSGTARDLTCSAQRLASVLGWRAVAHQRVVRPTSSRQVPC